MPSTRRMAGYPPPEGLPDALHSEDGRIPSTRRIAGYPHSEDSRIPPFGELPDAPTRRIAEYPSLGGLADEQSVVTLLQTSSTMQASACLCRQGGTPLNASEWATTPCRSEFPATKCIRTSQRLKCIHTSPGPTEVYYADGNSDCVPRTTGTPPRTTGTPPSDADDGDTSPGPFGGTSDIHPFAPRVPSNSEPTPRANWQGSLPLPSDLLEGLVIYTPFVPGSPPTLTRRQEHTGRVPSHLEQST